MKNNNSAMRVGPAGHAGAVLWMTGLSGSGKTSLGLALQAALRDRGYACYLLDGDALRKGLNADLGFSPQDRRENIRRAAELAALFCDAGLICIAAFISPYRKDRDAARRVCGEAFHEIHVAADLATCEARDPKGLYKKARSGELVEFTGVSAPYEAPDKPQLRIASGQESFEQSVESLLAYVLARVSKTGIGDTCGK